MQQRSPSSSSGVQGTAREHSRSMTKTMNKVDLTMCLWRIEPVYVVKENFYMPAIPSLQTCTWIALSQHTDQGGGRTDPSNVSCSSLSVFSIQLMRVTIVEFVRSIIAIPATGHFPLRREGDKKPALHPRSAFVVLHSNRTISVLHGFAHKAGVSCCG